MKIFYAYGSSKMEGAQILYDGLKQHLKDYEEDHKEFELDGDSETVVDQLYYNMSETDEEPPGHYKLA